MKKMRAAIIGQGRSGHDIHGKFFLSPENELVEVAAVVDAIDHRREKAKAEFGCDVYADYHDLLGRKDLDLVVNSTFSEQHYPIALDLLQHGFNVLNEKPFAGNLYECQNLIKAAKENGKIVTAFHQTLYNPAFEHVKEVVASGKLGRILQYSLRYSGFARRWDWQTLQLHCAGGLYNTGPHPVGQALDLLGWDENARVVFSRLDTALTSGDANDYAKVILAAPGKPVVDIEVSSADGFAFDWVYKVCGTKGTLISTNSSYQMKSIDPDTLEARPVIFAPLEGEGGKPIYCSEKLPFAEESGKIEGTSFNVAVKTFYTQLYAAVMEGKPLAITPEMASQVIGVIAKIHADNPLPVRY